MIPLAVMIYCVCCNTNLIMCVCVLLVCFSLLSTQKGTDTTFTMIFSAFIPVALLLLPCYAGSPPAKVSAEKTKSSSNTLTNTMSSCVSCDSQKIMPDGTYFSNKLYSNKYVSSDFTRINFGYHDPVTTKASTLEQARTLEQAGSPACTNI